MLCWKLVIKSIALFLEIEMRQVSILWCHSVIVWDLTYYVVEILLLWLWYSYILFILLLLKWYWNIAEILLKCCWNCVVMLNIIMLIVRWVWLHGYPDIRWIWIWSDIHAHGYLNGRGKIELMDLDLDLVLQYRPNPPHCHP
jgi:hypothetical protein